MAEWRIGYVVLNLVVGLLLFGHSVADQIWGRRLFDFSTRVSVELQRYPLTAPSFFFAYVLIYGLFFTPILGFFFQRDKVKASHGLLGPFMLIWLADVLKLVYADSRPCLNSSLLRKTPLFCRMDYGKPSGHALLSTGLGLYIAQDFNQHFIRPHWHWVSYLFGGGVAFATMLSKMYLAAHSINQLVLGFLWGVFAFLCMNNLRPLLEKHIFKPVLLWSSRKEKLRRARTLVGLILISMSITVLCCWLWTFSRENLGSDFFQAIVSYQISEAKLSRSFSTKIVTEALMMNMPMAMFLGFSISPIKPYSGLQFLSDRNLWKIPLRYAITYSFLLLLFFALHPRFSNPYLRVIRTGVMGTAIPFALGASVLSILRFVRLLPNTELPNIYQELVDTSSHHITPRLPTHPHSYITHNN